MGMIVSFLSFMLLFNYLYGIPQFTICPSSVCLSQPVTYECNSGGVGLTWIVLDANGDRVGNPVPYNQFSTVGDTGFIGTQFNTALINDTDPFGASITFTPTLSMNNYTVQCGGAGTLLVNCSIVITDIPAAPFPGNITFYSDRLNFSWSPSTSPCLSHYSVNVTSIEYTINTTDTSLSLPVPSPNDTEYSISVVAVDTGGRYMDPVDERTFVADVPEFVTNITLSQTGLSIDVSWEEPPALMFLSISSYIIYHDVTDPDTTITIPAPTTTYNIPNATVGSVYTVGVAAVNVLGTGDTSSAIISIDNTLVVATSSSMIVLSVTVTPSATSSSSSSRRATVAPSTSSGSTRTSAGGLGSTVYIGIGAGVAVIVIIILIILIIVGCLIWRKPWKGERENTTPNTVIYDTPTDTVHVPNVPVSMNTAYGKAVKAVEVDTTNNVAYHSHKTATSNTEAK